MALRALLLLRVVEAIRREIWELNDRVTYSDPMTRGYGFSAGDLGGGDARGQEEPDDDQ